MCTYFVLANATSLCNDIDSETLVFGQKQFVGRFVRWIEQITIDMFPYTTKKCNNTKAKNLTIL